MLDTEFTLNVLTIVVLGLLPMSNLELANPVIDHASNVLDLKILMLA